LSFAYLQKFSGGISEHRLATDKLSFIITRLLHHFDSDFKWFQYYWLRLLFGRQHFCEVL